MKVFCVNLKFNVKGVMMEITRQNWKDVVGLRQRGVKVRKRETTIVKEFNKVQLFNQCVRNPREEIHNFHVGRLRVDERFFVMIVIKILMPRGNTHSTLNEGDWVLMYCIQNDMVVDWTYTIRD